MKDNIFKTDRHQYGHDENFHDDAFQMLDTDGTQAVKNDRKDGQFANEGAPLASDEELMQTINQMGGLLDNTACPSDDEMLYADEDPFEDIEIIFMESGDFPDSFFEDGTIIYEDGYADSDTWFEPKKKDTVC